MKAIILAAGFGKRLLPLTLHTPKPLLTIHQKPLIVYHIENLVAAGISDIIINLYHLADVIKNYLGDGSQFGANIIYSPENEILETGGGITNALPLLGDEPFVVVNGDVFTNFPFALLIKHAKILNTLAHLILVPNPAQHPNGDYAIDKNHLVTLTDFPKYTFSGISLLTPELFKNRIVEKFRLPDCFSEAIQHQQLSAEIYSGVWHDIGTIERLEFLNSKILVSDTNQM